MNVGGLRFPRLTVDQLDRLLETSRTDALTYDHVGSTLSDTTLHSHERVLGSGREVFEAAVERLRRWAPQCQLGARIHPPMARAALGETVLIVLRAGPFDIVAPNRVVAVIDEPDRFGFAYGTLRGHPERGEESFVVERGDDDVVTASITADSEPGTIPARIVAPIIRSVQRTAIRRYLEALA